MHIKDHSAAMKFFRTYDNVASKGKWKEFVDEMEFDSMLQETRTMAQTPLVNELEPGALKDEMKGNFDPSQETHEEYLQRINLERPFNAAQGGQVIGKPGGLVEPGVMYYGKWKKYMKDNANVKKWKKLYPDKDFNTLSPNQQSLIRSQGNMKMGSGTKPKKLDKDLIKSLVEKANNSDKWYSREEISKLYAEEMGQTNVTKRKMHSPGKSSGKFVTYSLLGDIYIKEAGGLLSQEAKVEKVFKDILAMDGPVPEVDLKTKRAPGMANWKKYIAYKTGVGSAERIIPTLPDYKNNIEEFKYLANSQIGKKDLVNMSLSDQLIFAVDAAEGKPIFTGMKGLTKDPNVAVMNTAMRAWNQNKGKGNVIQFYNKKGVPITWKHGLELNVNDVSFSHGKSKKRFGIGDKKGTMNLRFEGKKYFPEVYENQKYINELKTTMVDNPFPGKKQIPFGELMKKVYMKGHNWKAKAPLFALFHGPEGVGKKPFTNLSFGMHELNTALYSIDRIPLKGLKQKVINQALIGLKGKKGGDLLEAIVAKHSEHASQVAGGQKFDKPLRVRVFEEVAKTGDLGSKESKYLQSQIEKVLAKQKVPKGERGFIATAMLEDFGKLGLKGGRLLKMLELQYEPLFEGLMYHYAKKYKGYDHSLAREELFLPKMIAKLAPDLWEKAGFKPFKTGIMEGADPLIEEQLIGTRWDPSGKTNLVADYADRLTNYQKEVDKYNKLDFELDMMTSNKLRTPTPPEKIEAKKKELADQRELIIGLESTLKPGTPAYEAYMRAKEKEDHKFGMGKFESKAESAKTREKRLHDEYLEYKGGKDRSFYLPKGKLNLRVEDPLHKKPYTFLKTEDTVRDMVNPSKEDWEYYGLTDTQVGPVIQEGVKEKWETIYDMGGIDLMDRIGIAGGVANMAEGGIMNLKKKW